MEKNEKSGQMDEFVARTTSFLLGTDSAPSSLFLNYVPTEKVEEWFMGLEEKVGAILKTLLKYSDFATKYDLSSSDVGSPMIYVYTTQPAKHTYAMEAFPTVIKSSGPIRQADELVFHSLFEAVIARYTNSTQKPNQALRDTRSGKLCYCLTVKIEAVPLESANRPDRYALVREFLILQHLWERYYSDMVSKLCGLDQMTGFPMPFEFQNVVGSSAYDFSAETFSFSYYNINGKQEKLSSASIPLTTAGCSTKILSSLSYMSLEKLGPSLSYLLDVMRSQGKIFSLSSALKVYDQILCRLLVMHRYNVVHCDPNPSCFNFGQGAICNVLYISKFGSSVVNPEATVLVPSFHDRFVSHLTFREKRCHFVHDLESAFYIFIYLLLGRLPWDSRMVNQKNDASNLTQAMQDPMEVRYSSTSATVDDKEKFWNSQDILNRTLTMIDLEHYESLYKSFSLDLIESLYLKTKEAMLSHSKISPVNYAKESNVPGSSVYNIYYGLRRIIVTYFRFESLNPAFKDVQGNLKIELLKKESTNDKRMAWDLSSWCWNYLDPNPQQTQRLSRVSRRVF